MCKVFVRKEHVPIPNRAICFAGYHKGTCFPSQCNKVAVVSNTATNIQHLFPTEVQRVHLVAKIESEQGKYGLLYTISIYNIYIQKYADFIKRKQKGLHTRICQDVGPKQLSAFYQKAAGGSSQYQRF